jgi:hypothetical protein
MVHPDSPSLYTATPTTALRICIAERLSSLSSPFEIKTTLRYLNHIALAAMTIISHHFDISAVFREQQDAKNGVAPKYRTRVSWKTQLRVQNSGLLRTTRAYSAADLDFAVLDRMDPVQETRRYVQKNIIDYLQTTRSRPFDYYKPNRIRRLRLRRNIHHLEKLLVGNLDTAPTCAEFNPHMTPIPFIPDHCTLGDHLCPVVDPYYIHQDDIDIAYHRTTFPPPTYGTHPDFLPSPDFNTPSCSPCNNVILDCTPCFEAISTYNSWILWCPTHLISPKHV